MNTLKQIRTQHMKLTPKIQKVYERESKNQQTTKPMLSICREHSWSGMPCDQCGAKDRAVLQRGRYMVTDGDEKLLFRVCGVCLSVVEQFFELFSE